MRYIRDILILLRPWQWTKNGFVLAPVFFAGVMDDFGLVARVFMAFGLFCLTSSAVYVFNDILDRDRDRAHPVKRNRPLAQDRVSPEAAWILSLSLAGVGIVGGLWLSGVFSGIILGYLLINVGYSLYFKRVAILDVLCLSSGFLLRVWAGGVAADVPVSQWLLICTLTFSLLLAFGKRRQELIQMGDNAGASRESLTGYSVAFLDHALTMSATATMITYLLYMVEGRPPIGAPGIGAFSTCLFVLYGIFRYLALVFIHREGEDPAALLLKDKPLLIAAFGWVMAWLLVLYFG